MLLTFIRLHHALNHGDALETHDIVQGTEWLKNFLIDISTQEELERLLKELIELFEDFEKKEVILFVYGFLHRLSNLPPEVSKEFFDVALFKNLGGRYRPTRATLNLFAQFPISFDHVDLRNWLFKHGLFAADLGPSPAVPASAAATPVSLRSLPAPDPSSRN